MTRQDSDSSRHGPAPRWWHSPAVVAASAVLAMLWLLCLMLAWFLIAGEAGSPQPDNWPVLERILDIVEIGLLATLVLMVATLLAWNAAKRGDRAAAWYPAMLLLTCVMALLASWYV